jgi:3-oxoacyl-[acyl-carrier protein] reductase
MRSIGHSIACELARAGCDVALTGTTRAADQCPPDEQQAGWLGVDSVSAEIEDLGRRALTVVTDVRDPQACKRFTDTVMAHYGRLDVLINAAAAPRGPDRVPVLDMSPEVWRRVIETNLNGTFYMSQAAARHIVAGGRGGSIINISSIAAKMMHATRSAYAASKVAVNALTSAMAKELGTYGVRVNAICPGYIATGRMDAVPEDERHIFLEQVPLERPGTALDVAALAVFLVSDQGSYVSGQQWNLDGGWVTMH